MRLGAAGAVFVAFAMVAAAVGIIASHALAPGLARLGGAPPQVTAPVQLLNAGRAGRGE